jgi:uncharacterized coiled-coil DUF342 family protein
MTKEDKKRKILIDRAYELDAKLQFVEDDLRDIVEEIQDLKPTRKELKNGVQALIDCYGRLI